MKILSPAHPAKIQFPSEDFVPCAHGQGKRVLGGNQKLQWDTAASGSTRMITIRSVRKMTSTSEDESTQCL